MDEGMRAAPAAVEAEKAAVGCLLLDALRVVPIMLAMGLEPEAWFVPGLRLVVDAILCVVERNKGCADVVLVGTELERTGQLEAAGGYAGLDGCCDAAVTAAHAEYYLNEVMAGWTRRKILQVCAEIEREAREGAEPILLAKSAPERFANVVVARDAATSNDEMMGKSVAGWEAAKRGEGKAYGLTTPWETMTEMLCGFSPGLHLIAARPSEGKTTLAAEMCMHWLHQGVGTAVASLDIGRSRLLERMMSFEAGVSLPKLKGGYAREDQLALIRDARGSIARMPLYLTEADRELRRWAGWVRTLVARKGLGAVVVDHGGQLSVDDLGRMAGNPYVTMSRVSGTCKNLAFELGLPVFLLCQLSRSNDKDDRPPRLSDLRDSGNLEQDASTVTFVYRDMKRVKQMEKEKQGSTRKQRPTWVDIAKNQDGEIGKMPFWFLASYFRFEETDDPEFTRAPFDGGQRTEDGGRRTEVGGQRTEDGEEEDGDGGAVQGELAPWEEE